MIFYPFLIYYSCSKLFYFLSSYLLRSSLIFDATQVEAKLNGIKDEYVSHCAQVAIEAKRPELTKFKTEIQGQAEELERLKVTLLAHKREIEELKTQKQELDNELIPLIARNKTLHNTLSTTSQEVDVKAKELKALTEAINDGKALIVKTRTKIAQLEEKKDRLTAEVEQQRLSIEIPTKAPSEQHPVGDQMKELDRPLNGHSDQHPLENSEERDPLTNGAEEQKESIGNSSSNSLAQHPAGDQMKELVRELSGKLNGGSTRHSRLDLTEKDPVLSSALPL